MAELIYEEPSKYSREEADRIFLSGDPAEITRLMIGLSITMSTGDGYKIIAFD